MINYFLKTQVLALSVFVLWGCGEPEPIKTDVQKLETIARGPLFEGVNTATVEFDIQKILPNEVKKEQLSEVRIKSIQLALGDSAAPVPNSFTVLLASPNTSMKECGFIQEESIKSNDYNVSLAKEQEFLEEILQDKMQTLVIDFDLKEDWFDDYTVTAVIDWELKFKN
tara:strand:+ start:1127 stop:1633 length:507 start_codon:yes stop_codon:yes gene_type:complete